jgi:RNase P subunit RPR2
MNIQFGLLETKLTTEDTKCQAQDCFRPIKTDAPCFVDVATSAVMCEHCGKSERYARKKQDAREKAGITEIPLIKGLDY